MEYEFLVGSELHKITLEKKGASYVVSLGDETFEADIRVISQNAVSILLGGKSFLVYYAHDKDRRVVSVNGHDYIVQEPEEGRGGFERGEEQQQQDKLIVKAPMPGKVIKVNVSEKDEVRKNQTLAIVEAMKMENEIKSSIDGYVKAVFVSPGDLVDSEKPLIELGLKE